VTDFDVKRVVEHEIEQLYKELNEGEPRSHEDLCGLYERLVDTQSLRIQHLEEQVKALEFILNDVKCSG
jgi:hypothetical protein